VILKNAAYCLKCETEVESVHRHDFRSCECGEVSVDGGHDYLRRVWGPDAQWVDRSVETGDDVPALRVKFLRNRKKLALVARYDEHEHVLAFFRTEAEAYRFIAVRTAESSARGKRLAEVTAQERGLA
jgi:hypothetical protein